MTERNLMPTEFPLLEEGRQVRGGDPNLITDARYLQDFSFDDDSIGNPQWIAKGYKIRRDQMKCKYILTPCQHHYQVDRRNIFWEKAIRTRAISCDKGAGALQAVAKYTTPYMSTVMVHGQRKAIKFEGDDMEAVYRNLHTAWYKQSPERRTRLLTLLLDRIQDYVGLKPEEYDPKAIASIPNLYKNRMDDLDELEADVTNLPPLLHLLTIGDFLDCVPSLLDDGKEMKEANEINSQDFNPLCYVEASFGTLFISTAALFTLPFIVNDKILETLHDVQIVIDAMMDFDTILPERYHSGPTRRQSLARQKFYSAAYVLRSLDASLHKNVSQAIFVDEESLILRSRRKIPSTTASIF
ncbi:hypothetical protein V8E54_000972 [Elaphomyces granulatus]